MANKNFTDFILKYPAGGDFLVGYNADGSAEYKTTVNALVSSYATNTVLNTVSSTLLPTSVYSSTSGSFATNTALNAASGILLPTSVYSSTSGSFATRSFTDSKYLPLSTTSVSYTNLTATNLTATNAFITNLTATNLTSILTVSVSTVSADASAFAVTATGSLSARTLADRFSEVINVKDYGAVGDGVTSDSAAIQAAFNACPIGGCLFFPPTLSGYRITTTVNLYQATGVANRKKNITFLGYNTKLRLVHANPSTDLATTIFEVRNTEGMAFEGLWFDGGHPYNGFSQGTTFTSGYFVYGTPLLKFRTITGFLSSEVCNNCSVNNCKFTNGRTTGIGFHDSDILYKNFVVQSCHFENLEGGIHSNPTGPKNFIIADNRFVDGQCRQWLDPSMWAGNRPAYHQGYFGFNSSPAIGLRIDAFDANVPENALDPKRATSARLLVANNIIDNWGHQGMELIGFKNVAITGNSISRVGYGISIAHRFNYPRSDVFSYSCTGNIFRGNLFYDLEWGVGGSTITGNTFDGRAIYNDNDGRTLCDYGIILYSVFGNKYPNIYDPDNLGNTINGNVFIAHRQSNIQLRQAINTTITNNILQTRRASCSVEVNYGSKNITIANNSFITKAIEMSGSFTGYNTTGSAIVVLGGSQPLSATSITRDGTTATVTCTQTHNLTAGDLFTIFGASQSAFNVTNTVLSTNNLQFQYTVAGTPSTDYGSINVFLNPLSADISSITQTLSIATVATLSAHDLVEGERAVIWGADQNEYNGPIIVNEVLNTTTFTYIISGDPATATGSLKLGKLPRYNTTGVSVINNTIDGQYYSSPLLFINDPSGTTVGSQSLTNVKIINNNSTPDVPAIAAGPLRIENYSTGSFRNFDIHNNTGGLASINTTGLRLNQKNVKTNSLHSGAPTWKPRWVGETYYDASPKTLYIATATSLSSDWKAIATA